MGVRGRSRYGVLAYVDAVCVGRRHGYSKSIDYS